MSQSVLVTGAAGFIGAAVCRRLIQRGNRVIGLDNLNSYYDPSLKQARLETLTNDAFRFAQMDLADKNAVAELFAKEKPELVVHLAAQAGVRYSLTHPHAYLDSNILGFLNVL